MSLLRQLLHVSGAELLRSRLRNCRRVDILDRCGHSVNIDRPGRLTQCLLQFRDEVADGSSQTTPGSSKMTPGTSQMPDKKQQ